MALVSHKIVEEPASPQLSQVREASTMFSVALPQVNKQLVGFPRVRPNARSMLVSRVPFSLAYLHLWNVWER